MITTQKTAKASTALHRSVRILGDNEVVYLADPDENRLVNEVTIDMLTKAKPRVRAIRWKGHSPKAACCYK